MKRNVFFMAVLMIVSSTCGSAFAQGRMHGMRDERSVGRREMTLRNAPHREYRMSQSDMRDGRHGHVGRPEVKHPRRPESPRHQMPHHGAPRLDAHGYVSGWHGRVRYIDGRWGYLRGRDWYWYDVYYEPEFYFSHPVAHFHGHLSPAGKVVAGAVSAAAVGAFIGALCR